MDPILDLLKLAKAGDATAAANLWRAIADGRVSDTVAAAWARDVAYQVVANVINPDVPANRARENARAALGLEGRVDKNQELKALVLDALPDATPVEIAAVADLVIDVGKADKYKIRRQIEYIRRKAGK